MHFTVEGCKSGGTLGCQNGGVCLNTGFCNCSAGFTGSTCSVYNHFQISNILSMDESSILSEMIQVSKVVLLYRATRDGFTANAFHSKCNNKASTITIIENHLNYVFGGYTTAEWESNDDFGWIKDSKAFIFSLRQNGTLNNKKFKVVDENHSILAHKSYGPSFGHDILIEDNSNEKIGSYCNLGDHYELPNGYKYEDCRTSKYLAGDFDFWLTKEIEVFQIITNY